MVGDVVPRAEHLVARYLDHVVDHEPVEATRLGLDDRNAELPELSPASLAARSRDLAVLAAEVQSALDDVPPSPTGVDREARDDLLLLSQTLEFRRFHLDVRPRLLFDPLAALDTVAAGIHELLRSGELGVDERRERVGDAVLRAEQVPRLLEEAGGLLTSSPAVHLDVAFQRLPGLIELLGDELPRHAADLGLDVSAAAAAGASAGEGLQAYAALLDELADEPPGEWRLGSHDHAVTLRTALGTTFDPQQIEDRARVWITRVRQEMAEIAAAGWSRRFPGEPVPAGAVERIRRTLEAVAATAVTRERLMDEARLAVDEARAFALDSGLTDVPPADRLRVTEVPPYLRGIAVAFLAQAPPLRRELGCTYYLSPVPEHWDAAQAESFLREYNPAQLRSLAIHEGYPGHFVQLEHAARHPRLARRLLARPVFAEGWAVYIEREMAAAGFADEGTSCVDGDDYRMTQLKLELRIATNALLDIGLHAGELADTDALRLLTCTAFQERAEAEGKLVRAKVTSGQLSSYFVGGEELTDLRHAEERRLGSAFDVRQFHQRVLSHGTPTTAIVADALADDAPVHRPFAPTRS